MVRRSIDEILEPDSMGLLVDVGPQEALRIANALRGARTVLEKIDGDAERGNWEEEVASWLKLLGKNGY